MSVSLKENLFLFVYD